MFNRKVCKVTNLLFLPFFLDRQNKEFSLFFILLQQILDKCSRRKILGTTKKAIYVAILILIMT